MMLETSAGPPAAWPSFADHAATLRGRHAVVTGVSGGIGRAVATAFAESGALVIGLDRTDELATDAVGALPRLDGEHAAIGVDFADPAAIAAALGQVRAVSKDIAALVNVAGYAADAVAQMVTQDALQAHMQVNFFGAVQIAQYVSRLMTRTGGGSIVSVSSVTALDGNPGQLAYGAAKAAVVAVTRTLAVELALDNIRVNAVAPGVTATPASSAYVDEDQERDRRAIAMGRRARPEEQAGAILFLLSKLSSYITGQTILVDGGLNLKWTHLGADNTSLFLKDESFRAAIKR